MTIFVILALTFFMMKHTELTTLKDFSNYLLCELTFAQHVIEKGFSIVEKNEHDIDIRKGNSDVILLKHLLKKKGKKGGYRVVYKSYTGAHNNSLKILNRNLTDLFKPSPIVHGFVKGRNIKSNANQHLSKRNILSVDIKNYFESITSSMISDCLIDLGFQKHIAEWIVLFTTLDGYLVQGFSTSPILANLVTKKLDDKLQELCTSDHTYTRYADDLYFSSNSDLPDLKLITETVENFGFTLNNDKTKFMKRGSHQYVTGLTVFDNVSARISKKTKRNIRLEIYYITKFGYKRHVKRKLKNLGIPVTTSGFKDMRDSAIFDTKNKLYGWLNYIHGIEPDFSNKCYEKLKKAKK